MPRTPEQFVRARREAWTRLEDLVDQAQRNRLASLSDGELLELGTLYRRASADLARAQTRYATTLAGQDLVRSLNALVLRAYAQIYSAPAPTPSTGWKFLLHEFPAAFRRHWLPILLAALLMYGPALLAYLVVWTRPDTADWFVPHFVPDGAIAEVEKRGREGILTGWGANTNYQGLSDSPALSSTLMTHNIQVSILALGLGVTAGLGTAYVLVKNGVMLGVLAAVATNNRVDLPFWSVILPHGVLELTAICIAGGAGLVIARALYAPGDLPRNDALQIAGIEAGKLMIGVVVFLVCAGFIEAFITPTTLPPFAKLLFALLSGVGMVFYLVSKGPRPRKLAK